MSRNVIVFANGWDGEIVENVIQGMREGMSDIKSDIYLFLTFPLFADSKEGRTGEFNIYNLPDLSKFDAAVIIGNGLDYEGSFDLISNKCKEAGIITVSIAKKDDAFYNICTDNYSGMRKLCEHIIEEHNVKDIFYMAGNEGNDDNDVRFSAICDVTKEKGLSFSRLNSYETNWMPKRAEKFVLDVIKRGRKLPDAFMCANDNIAMSVCTALSMSGIQVPRDIIVTGFDHDRLARTFDPVISTVDQQFYEVGLEAAGIIDSVISGYKMEKENVIPCKAVFSESCGCFKADYYDKVRRNAGREKYRDYLKNELFNADLNTLENNVMAVNSFAEVPAAFEKAFRKSRDFADDFAEIIVDPMFYKSVGNGRMQLHITGYSDTLEPVLTLCDNIFFSVSEMERERLIAKVMPDDDSHVYIFLPIHEENKTYGYCILRDCVDKLTDNDFIVKYKDRLNDIFAKLRKNLYVNFLNDRLLQLTETDNLTHVKNKVAYEGTEKKYNNLINGSLATTFAVCVFDINGLKVVNDMKGHELGDRYLLDCCYLICTYFCHSPVYRIGGDEFVAFLTGSDYDNRERLFRSFKDEVMEKSSDSLDMLERRSIASGMAVYNAGSDKTVADVFERANTYMNDNKAQMKKANT